VLTIDPREGPHAHGELPGADIALHLARHGVKAQIERTVSAGLPVGEVLLSRAADLGVDLIAWVLTVIPACAKCCWAARRARCCAA
jgi:hypothetical protein